MLFFSQLEAKVKQQEEKIKFLEVIVKPLFLPYAALVGMFICIFMLVVPKKEPCARLLASYPWKFDSAAESIESLSWIQALAVTPLVSSVQQP